MITRHGTPVVELRAVKPAQAGPRPMTQADFDWLDLVRIKLEPGAPNSATLEHSAFKMMHIHRVGSSWRIPVG